MRLVRYADDFVVLVHGTRQDAEALWDEVTAVLAPIGLRLSEEKTRVCHVDEGFDFLGWRIVGWLRKRDLGLSMHTLVRRFLPGWTIREGGIELLRPSKMAIERYRFRGTRIPTRWSGTLTV